MPFKQSDSAPDESTLSHTMRVYVRAPIFVDARRNFTTRACYECDDKAVSTEWRV